MSTLKAYFNINSYSFTFLVLLYALLAWLDVFPPLATGDIFIFFIMTTCITFLIQLTDKLPIANPLLCSLIRILDIVFVVYTIGFLSDLFPLNWINILTTLGMIVLIYFCVYGVMMIKDQADAKAINKQIRMNMSKAKGEEDE